MSQITVSDLKRRIEIGEDLQLIDVRSPGEFAAGHVPGAINIPLEQLEGRLPDLNRDKELVILCQSGRRAAMGCDVLRPHHDELLILEGGTAAWQSEGNQVVACQTARWSIERQVRLTAGALVLIGSILALTGTSWGVFVTTFIGAGLTFAGLTNICGMASLFAKMPWNKPTTAAPTSPTQVQN